MGIQEFIEELGTSSILVVVGFLVVIGFVISIVQENKSKAKRKKALRDAAAASVEKSD